MSFYRMSVTNMPTIMSDTVVIDTEKRNVVFFSTVGYSSVIKKYIKLLNNVAQNVFFYRIGSFKTTPKQFQILSQKNSNDDFTHMVGYLKDNLFTDRAGNENLSAYIFYNTDEEKLDILYDKLYKHTAVPILKEWMSYIWTSLENNHLIRTLNVYGERTFKAVHIHVAINQLIQFITLGVQRNQISICNNKIVSDTMINVTGLDDYLNHFGDILARRIQQSFNPKFVPGITQYDEVVNDFDDFCYANDINIFDAQKAAVQAMRNHFKSNNIGIVVGEMGIGKTLIGSGITYCGKKQLGNTNVIMCPAHLTYKWKREVEKEVPNAVGYIVKNLTELLALDSKIKNKNKKENMYIIIGKESAKFSYEKCPAGIWSVSKNAFVCPECGQVLTKSHWETINRRRTLVTENLSKTDFAKEYSFNKICTNKVRKWNKQKHVYEQVDCHTKLWKPLTKEEYERSPWIKLGKDGWILKNHIKECYYELIQKPNLKPFESNLLIALSDKVAELDEKGSITTINRAPRKYSLSKYIKKYYKGKIDYFIADEVHQLKGESEQGYAFAEFVQAAKKTLCLTGTLLNGYASGLFYILYRLIPRQMLEEGFEYNDVLNFARVFGVIQRNNQFNLQGNRIGNTSEKQLPGVSPLVFTKFLLEHTVFLSLSDISDSLPSYQEIPIGVDMDSRLTESYNNLVRNFQSMISSRNNNIGYKLLGQMLQTLSVYPDMPYNQPPVLNPDTKEVLFTPTELDRELRMKELTLLELVENKISQGEKVLIYYQWTNRTDIAKKFKKALTDRNISTTILESKIEPDKREEWINNQLKKGAEVVICNPALVETGLDLIPFTTIIFYEIGYNIYTMRQASRRSWRLGQQHDIEVYFLYYRNTIQEQALSLMATKLQASMAIEGKFSEEGLRALSNNQDMLTQIANSVVNGIKETVSAEIFTSFNKNNSLIKKKTIERQRKTKDKIEFSYPRLSYLDYFNPVLRQTPNPKITGTELINKILSDQNFKTAIF